MYHIFVDESGNLNDKGGEGRLADKHMISAVVISDHVTALRHLVRDTKREARPKIKQTKVLHAADDPPKVIENLLRKLSALENVELFVSIFDKRWWLNQDMGHRGAYQMLIADAIQRSMLAYNIPADQVEVIIERRDRNLEMNKRFRSYVSQVTGVEVSKILLEGKISAKNNSRGWSDILSISDYIAWSYYQKVEREQEHFVELIDHRILVQNVGISGEGKVQKLGTTGFYSEEEQKKTNQND